MTLTFDILILKIIQRITIDQCN